jgi:ketosteroid isomerase-like protein
MSQENVEVVRGLADSFDRRDYERAFDFYAAEAEWDASELSELVPDLAGVYRGHEGIRTFWRLWLVAWKDIEYDREILDAGDEVVMLVRHQVQRGRHSGIETALPPYALVFTFDDGKIVRVHQRLDQQAALEAVGLRE